MIRDHNRIISKDLNVTDNGDGTLTIIFFQTGNSVLYGPDGKAIARNPGRPIGSSSTMCVRPSIPKTTRRISFELIKGSTGRSDDFCAAAVDVLTWPTRRACA